MVALVPDAAKRDLLQGLGHILSVLAARLQTQGDAAREVAQLAPRAETLAAQAWQLASSRFPDGKLATALAAELAAFVEDAAAIAQRAAVAAATTREVSGILRQQASDLSELADVIDGTNDGALIRVKLRPMLTVLATLPARMLSMTAIAKDVAALGSRATGLADRAPGLGERARNPGIAATAIYQDLRAFANEAGEVAETMSADAEGVRKSIAGMSALTGRLAAPETAASIQRDATALGRIDGVIAQAASERQKPPQPAAAEPVRGMVWNSGGGKSR